jgi:hypothetical protein
MTMAMMAAAGLPEEAMHFEILWVPFTRLVEDEEFQRPVNVRHVAALKQKWKPHLAAILWVGELDGQLLVIDGRHSMRAMKELGYKGCWCQVTRGLTRMEIYDAFYTKNKDRLSLRPVDLFRFGYMAGYAVQRQVLIGKSDTANGWTDGSTFIAIDRRFLKGLKFDVAGFVDVGRLLLHEYCHTDSSAASHVHGAEFYEAFHDACRDHLGKFVAGCLDRVRHTIRQAGRELDKATLKDIDRTEKARLDVQALAPAPVQDLED